MKPTIVLSILALAFLSGVTQAQKVLHEFTSKAMNDEFNMFGIGDTLVVSYSERLPNSATRKTVWITEESLSNNLVNEDIYTTISKGSNVYMYYLDGKKRSRELKALIYNRTSGAQTESQVSIPIDGSLVGSYSNGNLFIILIDKEALNLVVSEIDGMTVVNEKKFAFPFKITGFSSSIPVDFFSDQSGLNSFKGASTVKIYRYGSDIYMTIDLQEKTLVARFDLQTGQITSEVFNADVAERFSSFLVDGKLFRIYNSKMKFLVTIVDIATKKMIASSEMLPPATDFKAYFRYGSKSIVSHKATFRQMLKVSPVSVPSIFVSKEKDSYVIQWGSYYNREQSVVFIPGPSLASLMAAVISNAIWQMRDSPGITRYFNYEWDQQNSFKIRDYSNQLLKEKIDMYEIESMPRVKYKSYINYKNGIAGIYYKPVDSKIFIVYYE